MAPRTRQNNMAMVDGGIEAPRRTTQPTPAPTAPAAQPTVESVSARIADLGQSVQQFGQNALENLRRNEQTLLDRAARTGRARDIQAASRASRARFDAEAVVARNAQPTGGGDRFTFTPGGAADVVETGDGEVFTVAPAAGAAGGRVDTAQDEANRLERARQETERMQREANQQRERVAARDLLNNWLSTFFDPNTPEYAQARAFVEQQIANDATPDAVQLNIRNEQFYRTRFRGNEGRRAAGLAEYSPAEYLQAENSYNEVLRRFGLERMARRETFGSLIGGMVSADELAERVSTVYDRIVNADAPLRAELQRLKTTAGLTDQDLAESLLLGNEGAQSLQRKIRQAEIRSEATVRGLTSRIGDVELEQRGITRAQAAAGFEQVATEMPALERLSQIYERQAPAPAAQLQTELESEALLGQTSQRRRRLAMQEAATFSGAAGTTPTLASRARAGQF